jgi:hypothetical protein
MTREEMLRALQADVNEWPQRVKEAGVTNAAGAAYVPVARNNEILRTPDDPEATYAYMVRAWEAADAESGSEGWYRIIAQAGPTATWEWLMVDEQKPYAPLFSAELRARVRGALMADAGYTAWIEREAASAAAEDARAERVKRMRDEMRSGKRKRPSLPELDQGL